MSDEPEKPAPLPPTPVLETPRLILRPLRASDAPTIQRRFPQWEVVRFLSAIVPWPYPPDGAAANTAACLAELEHNPRLNGNPELDLVRSRMPTTDFPHGTIPDAAEDLLRQRGCVVADLDVIYWRTELPPIYRRYGYVETGIKNFDPQQPVKQPGLQCRAILMSKPL